MNILRLIVLILICIFQLFVLPISNIYAKEIQEDKLEVLFISSFDYGFISFEDQIKGIKEGLNNNANLRVEYMDLKIFNSKESEESFYNLLKHSLEIYNNIDIVIAGDDEATEFCIRYRDDLFKDIPVSFLGVQDYERRNRALDKDMMSGVTEIESIKENIELIKRFHPYVDTITFIDTYATERYDEITSEYKEFNFEWIITNDIPIDEVKNMLSKLDENDALIQLYVSNFNDNNVLSKKEINNFIVENSNNVPIYNILSYDIGSGSIGGKVINHFNQGKNAAQIAIELLDGKEKNDIYISDDSANSYIFDYKYLSKFGIKKRDLPKGSIILNNPNVVFEEYKGVIIGFVMLLLGLICIVIALLWNIYYRIKYEKAMLVAMNNAEEANKMKTHFIANISHELKTPINVIMSAVQLNKLKSIKTNNSSDDIDNLYIIDDNCNRLLRLINNIIDVQKSELNEAKLQKSCINVVELIENLVTSVVPYAESKNLNLVFDTDEEEIIMDVDINKIERIILNLLSNAIKYSKSYGEIRINLKFEDVLYIIIEDDGIGIDESNINKIFDKFTQIDNSLCRKTEGSGIGLSIVKSFVELHNGSIFVDSKINEGTRFTIAIPINIENNRDKIDINIEKLMKNIKMELSDIYV